MEPPFKRRRIAGSSSPEIDLHTRRTQNDFRLKSIFESIFDKYGRDFDGIGDEIDLETGEIVVNNGHILGMTDERDAGDAKYSSEGLGNCIDEDDHSSIEYSEEHLAALGPSKAGDSAVTEESEASGQSDFDADSLMGDVPAESHLHQLSKKSRKAVSIPSDEEEDELASSDVEWTSHSKDRLDAQESWCLVRDRYSNADEPAIEAAWRAPPLPSNPILKRESKKVGLTSVDNLREYSDDERAGISLWTPEVKKRPRRRHEGANSISQRSLSVARGLENNADGPLSDSSNSEPAVRKMVKWTQGEEELLVLLKKTKNLTGAAMESYFPGRPGNAIASHWTYMITRGKANPKSQVPTISRRRISLPSLFSSKKSLAPDGTRPEPQDPDAFRRAKEPPRVQQQLNKGFLEARSLFWGSSEPFAEFGDHHMNSQYKVGGFQGAPNGDTLNASILISDDVGVPNVFTRGGPFPSARDCETEEAFVVDEVLDNGSKPLARMGDYYHPVEGVHNLPDQSSISRDQKEMRRTKRTDPPEASACGTSDTTGHVDGVCKIAESAYQANSDDSYADPDHSYRLSSKPLELKDDIIKRRKRRASILPDNGLQVVSSNGGGALMSFLTTPIKAKQDFEGAEPCSDSIDFPDIQPRFNTAMEASNSPKRPTISHSGLQRDESIPTAKANMQRGWSTAEQSQKTGSTNLVSANLAQPPNHGELRAPYEPKGEVNSETFIKRQFIQVVVPVAATNNVIRKHGDITQILSSYPHISPPLTTTETEDPASIRQLAATAESAPATLGPCLPYQEDVAIRTPTRSPSVTAAESQYAASAAYVLDDVRSSLGPEIADSQPLTTTPVVATLTPEIGGDATRPIILDAESQNMRMTPGGTLSARKHAKEATKINMIDSATQALRVTPGTATATPMRKRIEEATESDIVESGSHPLSKTLLVARSSLKKVKKEIVTESFSPTWTAMDDYSEDELSYL